MTSANTMILHALQEMVCAEKNISRGDKEKALGHIKLAEGSMQEMARRVRNLTRTVTGLRKRAEGMHDKCKG